MQKFTWVSFGETCSSQLFINSNLDKIKTVYTPYTWTACNIDYALHFEENGYEDLTNTNKLIPEPFREEDGVGEHWPMRYQSEDCPLSLTSHDERTRNFIPWHNNLLGSELEWGKWLYRVGRMKRLKDVGPLVLLYYNDFPNRDRLQHVRESLIKLRESHYPDAQVVLFYYTISESERKLNKISNPQGLLEFEMRVPKDQVLVGGELVQDFYSEIIKTANQSFET